MKRFFVFIVLLILVSWVAVRHRGVRGPVSVPPGEGGPPGRAYSGHESRRISVAGRQQTQRALAEARQVVAQVRNEVRHAVDETHDELRHAIDRIHISVTTADDSDCAVSPQVNPTTKRESADGLPVLIVPGTRVTEAIPQPPGSGIITVRSAEPIGLLTSNASQTSIVAGEISATEERAKAEVRRKLRAEVVKWLDPDVPNAWSCPQSLLDSLILQTHITPHVKDYGTLFVAELTVDSSRSRRAALIDTYNRELVARRMVTLSGLLAFVLVCLAAVSGYIRADEATKGYYTNWLRMLVAAGVAQPG